MAHLIQLFGDSETERDLLTRARGTTGYFWQTFNPAKAVAIAGPVWNLGRDRAETAGQTQRRAQQIAAANTATQKRQSTLQAIVEAVWAARYINKGMCAWPSEVAGRLASQGHAISVRTVQRYWSMAEEVLAARENGRSDISSCLTGLINKKEGDQNLGAGDIEEICENQEMNPAAIKARQINTWISAQRGSIFRDTADEGLWASASNFYYDDVPPSIWDPELGGYFETKQDWFVNRKGVHWLRIPAASPPSWDFWGELFETDFARAVAVQQATRQQQETKDRAAERQYRREQLAKFAARSKAHAEREVTRQRDNFSRWRDAKVQLEMAAKIARAIVGRRSAKEIWAAETMERRAKKKRDQARAARSAHIARRARMLSATAPENLVGSWRDPRDLQIIEAERLAEAAARRAMWDAREREVTNRSA